MFAINTRWRYSLKIHTCHSGLTPDRGLSTAPSHSKPSTTQFFFFFFQAQMWPKWENELLFNYHPAFNILWPILSHVYLHPLSLPDFFFFLRNSQTFCHFTHKYFRTCLSQIKIHSLLLLKMNKPISFLCSGSSKEGCTEVSQSIPLFLEGTFPFLFTLTVLHPRQGRSHPRSLPSSSSLSAGY